MGQMNIPEQLRGKDFRFIKVAEREKRAIEKEWQTYRNYHEDDPALQQHMSYGGNYGVLTGFGNLAILDIDDKDALEVIEKRLPVTFTVTTGHGKHFYYFYESESPKKIILERGTRGQPEYRHYGELQAGRGFYVVGPSSTHPSGRVYDHNSAAIATISASDMLNVIIDYMPKDKPTLVLKSYEADELELNIEDVISTAGMTVRGDERQGPHPFHGSEGGFNFCTNPSKGVWHCFRHNCGGGAISLLAIKMGVIECGDPAPKGEDFKKVLAEAEKITGKIFTKKMRNVGNSGDVKARLKDAIDTFDVHLLDLAEAFIEVQPMYYDDAGLIWVWSFDRCCYIIVDEIDVMNLLSTRNESRSKTRDMPIYKKEQIMLALKMVARKRKPLDLPATCVQFRDQIFDYKTKAITPATPDIFCTNPIPWKLGKSTSTPTIDKLFKDWVEPRYQETLKEIPAFCVTNGHKIRRAFFLAGTGANGKTKYQKLLRKLLGDENCCASTLKSLEEDQFARFTTYKKQVVLMGETSYEDMKNSEMFKAMTGEDPISFRQLYHQSITALNKAKLIVNSNGLPTPSDDSKGFWDRVLPIEFPNEFKEGPCPIEAIPNEEFENLCLRITEILPDLMARCTFSGEGTSDERKKRYLSLSNPLGEFLNENYIKADGFRVKAGQMFDEYTRWLVERRRRKVKRSEFKDALIEAGFDVDRQRPSPDEDPQQCVMGIRKALPLERHDKVACAAVLR